MDILLTSSKIIVDGLAGRILKGTFLIGFLFLKRF